MVCTEASKAGWYHSEWEGTIIIREKLTWYHSEWEGTVGPERTIYSTHTWESYCSTLIPNLLTLRHALHSTFCCFYLSVVQWWSSGGRWWSWRYFWFEDIGLRSFDLGGAVLIHVRERDENKKKEAFVFIDCKDYCFCLLTLFHLSKTQVLVTCMKVPSKMIVKLTSEYKG